MFQLRNILLSMLSTATDLFINLQTEKMPEDNIIKALILEFKAFHIILLFNILYINVFVQIVDVQYKWSFGHLVMA